MKRVAFKEWHVVCEALGRGGQSVILRKGGISDARGRFRFEDEEFFLFPTLFHEQSAKLRPGCGGEVEIPPEGEEAARSEIALNLFARIDFQCAIEAWDVVAKLEPFHIWSAAEIRKRFERGDAPGISLAFARIYRLSEPWIIPNHESYGGCRSWITLPEWVETPAMEPVLDDEAHRRVREQLVELLGDIDCLRGVEVR